MFCVGGIVRSGCLAGALSTLVMYSQSVLAEAWILEPSVKLTVQADDNVALDDRFVSQ